METGPAEVEVNFRSTGLIRRARGRGASLNGSNSRSVLTDGHGVMHRVGRDGIF